MSQAPASVQLHRQMAASLRTAGVTPTAESRRSSAAATPALRPPSAGPSPGYASVSQPAGPADLNGPAFAASLSPCVRTASGLLSLPENGEIYTSPEASEPNGARPATAAPALTVASSGSVAQGQAGDTAQGGARQLVAGADAGDDNVHTREWRMGSPPIPTSQSVNNLADHFGGECLGQGGRAPTSAQPSGGGGHLQYCALPGQTSLSAGPNVCDDRAAKDAADRCGSAAGMMFPSGSSGKQSLEGGWSPQPSLAMFGLFSPTAMGSLVPSLGGAPSLGSLMDLRSLGARMGSEGGYDEAGTRPIADVGEDDLMLPRHGLIRFPTDDPEVWNTGSTMSQLIFPIIGP